jgi:hypothetical protein
MGAGISVFTITSRQALELTQPLIQWVFWAVSPGIK